MKFRKFVIVAIICCMCAFTGCSEKDKDSSESASESQNTTKATVTSIVTVTDDQGKDVTDDAGEIVTSIVTVVDDSDSDVQTTTAPFVTSISETIVTQNITVTDSQGEAVTDTQGNTQTEVVTSVSQVVVTVKPTTTARTTTTAATAATTTRTVATTTAVTTVSQNTSQTISGNSTTTTTTTTSAAISSAAATTTTTTTQTTSGDVTLKISDIDYPSAGDCFGTVSIPKVGIEMDLYMGDTNQILRKGIGMYMGSYLPGYENRTILCGHNSSGYLNEWVNYAKANDTVGEQIIINTTYGDYVYEIYKTEILDNSDTSYFSSSYSTSTLILYSCMESDYTNERIYFVAKKISGPVLVR